MKAELNEHGCLEITPENMAESMALKYMFIDKDVSEWTKSIIISAEIERDELINNKDK